MRVCSIEGCERKHYSLGMCSLHYQRKFKHGDPDVVLVGNLQHGMSMSPENNIWRKIKGRCYRKTERKFSYYGGRGIGMCDKWRESFVAFYEDVGPRPGPEYSLNRIDNDGDYEPGNVEWATREQQQNNRSNNIVVTINGHTQTLSQWCRSLGLKYTKVRARIKEQNWSPERALELTKEN